MLKPETIILPLMFQLYGSIQLGHLFHRLAKNM